MIRSSWKKISITLITIVMVCPMASSVISEANKTVQQYHDERTNFDYANNWYVDNDSVQNSSTGVSDFQKERNTFQEPDNTQTNDERTGPMDSP
jgi:hypothetical protein